MSKKIVINDCRECPIRQECKEFNKFSLKEKLVLEMSDFIVDQSLVKKNVILKNCPLENN